MDALVSDVKINVIGCQIVLQQQCSKIKIKKPNHMFLFGCMYYSGKLVFCCRGDMASGLNVHCNLMLQSSSLLPSHRAALALLVFRPGALGVPLGPTFPPTQHCLICHVT